MEIYTATINGVTFQYPYFNGHVSIDSNIWEQILQASGEESTQLDRSVPYAVKIAQDRDEAAIQKFFRKVENDGLDVRIENDQFIVFYSDGSEAKRGEVQYSNHHGDVYLVARFVGGIYWDFTSEKSWEATDGESWVYIHGS